MHTSGPNLLSLVGWPRPCSPCAQGHAAAATVVHWPRSPDRWHAAVQLGRLWRATRWWRQHWGGEAQRTSSAVGMRTRPHRVREPGRRQRRRNSPGTALLVAVLRRNTWTGGRPERRLERQLLGGPDDVGSLERPSTGRGATSARRWRDGHLHGKRWMKAWVAAADAGERQRIAMASDTVEGEEEIRRKMWLQTVGGVGSKPWRL
jgi:hypothetical protein